LNTQRKRATLSAICYHVKWEITEGGATDKSIKKYIEDLHKAGLIEYNHPFYKISNSGKEWLERHAL